MNIIPPLYKYGAIAIICAAALITASGLAYRNGSERVQARWDAQIAKDVKDAAEHRVEAAESNTKEIVRYVETIRTIPSDPVIRDRIVRIACPADRAAVPGGPVVADRGGDADAGQLALARDIAAAKRNQERLRSVKAVVQRQQPEPQ